MNQYQNYTFYPNEVTPILLPQKPPRARLHTGMIAFSVTLGMILALVVQLIIFGIVEVAYPSLAENDWYMWAFSTLHLIFKEKYLYG